MGQDEADRAEDAGHNETGVGDFQINPEQTG